MRTTRIVLFALLVLFLSACAAPQPYLGGGYSQQYQPIPAGWANAYTPYMGMHGGRCYYHGFVQPTPDVCRGIVVTNSPYGLAPQSQVATGSTNSVVPQGMTPERAKARIAELNQRYANLCSGENRTKEAGIGAAIGAVAVGAIGAVTARKGERSEKFVQGAVVGGIGGAAVGSGSVVQTCQALYDERHQLQQIADAGEPRCLDGLKQREVNGVLTTEKSRDCAAIEGKDFTRIGQGAQIGRTVPPSATRPQSGRTPGVVLGGPTDEKPPK